MKTYDEMVLDLKPYSDYLSMSYGKKDTAQSIRIPTFNFDKDGKRYRIMPIMHVHNCCGAKVFISTDAIPPEILDPFCSHFMKCHEMLIFIMPQLPSQTNKVCDGVGVIGSNDRPDPADSYNVFYDTVNTLPYYYNSSERREHRLTWETTNLLRYTYNVYFLFSLNESHERLEKLKYILGLANPDNVLLAISVPSQSGDAPVKKSLPVMYTCINPKSHRKLQLFAYRLGYTEVQLTFLQRLVLSVNRFIHEG